MGDGGGVGILSLIFTSWIGDGGGELPQSESSDWESALSLDS